jgi:hypothetical protein
VTMMVQDSMVSPSPPRQRSHNPAIANGARSLRWIRNGVFPCLPACHSVMWTRQAW